jgi:D-alanine transaminase
MPPIVYLDGAYIPRAEARISIDDRGFLFGDGIYEVTRVVGGRPFEIERHLARLRYGLDELAIAGAPDDDALLAIHERLLAENGLEQADALVYVQVTRGAARRTHHFPQPAVAPTVFAAATPFAPDLAVREKGGAAITYPDMRWARCDLKTVNLLPNVLAKQHAQERGVLEALLVRDGAITEGSHTNVFAVVEGELRTHPRSDQILGGVTRDVVLELAAEQGIPVRERPIHVRDLANVDEIVLSGTTTDVTPIVSLDGAPVGGGEPGPIARALYRALVERMGAVAESVR